MLLSSIVSSKESIKINLSPFEHIQNDSRQHEYISSVILIDPTTICTVSQYGVKFYSLTFGSNSQSKDNNKGQLIGQLSVQRHLRKQFNRFYNIQKGENFLNQQDLPKVNNQYINIETDFTNPTLIEQKGVIYDHKTKQFYVLISTSNNKYLVQFRISFQKQQPLQSISINNFHILYNFANPPSIIKYNLQVDPQLLYLEESQTIVLIRKFYSDSLVIVFRKENSSLQQLEKQVEKLAKTQSEQSTELGIIKTIMKKSSSQANHSYNEPPQFFWQFYINQQCLSALENSRYLVNYRQVITKHTIEIDLIDVLNKQKISFKLTEAVEPMTIRHVQLLTYNFQASCSTIKQSKPESFVIRIFAVLKQRQASFIIDYDVVHGVVIKTYLLEDMLIERVSQFSKNKRYCLVSFLYHDKIFIGVLRRQLKAQEEKVEKRFIEEIIQTGVQVEMNQFVWNVNMEIIFQYKISIRNQTLELNLSKIVKKNTYYISILDQLKQADPVLQDNQFLTRVYQILNIK